MNTSDERLEVDVEVKLRLAQKIEIDIDLLRKYKPENWKTTVRDLIALRNITLNLIN